MLCDKCHKVPNFLFSGTTCAYCAGKKPEIESPLLEIFTYVLSNLMTTKGFKYEYAYDYIISDFDSDEVKNVFISIQKNRKQAFAFSHLDFHFTTNMSMDDIEEALNYVP